MSEVNKCPECGDDMTGRDPEKEIYRHWGEMKNIEKDSREEIMRRVKILRGMR